MAGRTSFVIAHRLSTIRDSDQIWYSNPAKSLNAAPTTFTKFLASGSLVYGLRGSQGAGDLCCFEWILR
jgi:ABC-type multidrug transport system fused ATPase/permease subunit